MFYRSLLLSVLFFIIHNSYFIISPHAQQITLKLTDPHRGLLHLDSANWDEAWIEVDGTSPLAKKLSVADLRVTSGDLEGKILSIDSLGARFGSHLALSFVLDNSGSMFHAYDSLTRMCDSLVDSLPDGAIFQAVTFDNTARSESHLYTRHSSVFIAASGFRDSAATIRSFWHFFDTIRTSYTPFYDAIAAAIANIQSRRLSDSTALRNDVLIAVTDGSDNASRASIETLKDLLSTAHLRLYTINFRRETDTRLVWLARHSGGEYFRAEDIPDLRDLMRQIGWWLVREYHVTYRFPSRGPIRKG
jgi:hypothetical protein